MKPFFDLVRLTGQPPKTIFLLLAFATFAAGCGKSSSPPAAPPPANPETVSSTPAPTPAPAPAPVPAANPQPATTTNSTSLTTLQFLNRAMVRWMRTNHRRPRDFQEFASTSNVQIPDPPPGKKYTLNPRGFVVLSDISTQ